MKGCLISFTLLSYIEIPVLHVYANSVDPDQMPHTVASDLGLHCPFYRTLGINWLNHTEMMMGSYRKALCNEVPYSQEMNSISSGIQIQDLTIQSQKCQLLSQADASCVQCELDINGLM